MVETFPIVPGHVRIVWVVVPILLVLVLGVGTLFYSLSGAQSARFEISSDGLRLRGDFYGRFIPAAQLEFDGLRVVDLRHEDSLAPVSRTVGTAIPGYRAGWFKLRDGEKALLYLTDPTRVAYVPTTEGYAVMVSVADPSAFLASLRGIAPRP